MDSITKEFFNRGKKIAKWADNNMKQHKWHKEIKAWADGAEIEWWNVVHQQWEIEKEPMWSCINKYRIKPQPVEPQYIKVYGYLENQNICFQQQIGMPYIGKIPLIVESNDD